MIKRKWINTLKYLLYIALAYGVILLILKFTNKNASDEEKEEVVDEIYFNTQDSLERYFELNPGLRYIRENLSISGGDINSLTPLSQLDSIGGRLTINTTKIKSLAGLENIKKCGTISMNYNDSIKNLTGLSSLKKIRTLSINNNATIESFSGLPAFEEISRLEIENNPLLSDLSVFNNLKRILDFMVVSYNNSLISLNDFNSLESIRRRLTISGNKNLIILDGLDSLTRIGGNLYIEHNESLERILTFKNLESVDYFKINHNKKLIDISGLEFTEVANSFRISNNINLNNCKLETLCSFLEKDEDSVNVYANGLDCANTKVLAEKCGVELKN